MRSPAVCFALGVELVVRAGDVDLPATLTMPEGDVRAGIVALHGSSNGERGYFLYQHLSEVCGAAGIAVLRYDRRRSETGSDIDVAVQARDALAAVRALRAHVRDATIGLWGFSQGAWAAPVAAVSEPTEVAFLVLVSACGVSPGEQMRIGSAKQLSKAGFAAADLQQVQTLRLAVEDHLRGHGNFETAQALLDAATEQPWFELIYLPPVLPPPGGWADMDYDPWPVISRVTCPVLAFYGETDEWMPIDESITAWHRAEAEGDLKDLTVVRLTGADHLPTLDGRPDLNAIVPAYAESLIQWITARAAV